MELKQTTLQDVEALSQVTGQKPDEIVENAVEQFMKTTGQQLIRQQAQQRQAQEQAQGQPQPEPEEETIETE